MNFYLLSSGLLATIGTEFAIYFIFGINIPWLAVFVIPAPDYEIRGQAPAGMQKCKVVRGFWIPDQQTCLPAGRPRE